MNTDDFYIILHLDALKWIERNGIDVLNNEQHFRHFAKFSPAEIMEYLMVEKGMTFEYLLKNMDWVFLRTLKTIYKVKGIEGIQRFDPEKIVYDFASVKFLESIGYNFDREIMRVEKTLWIYPFVCCKVLKYEDMNENRKVGFDNYVKNSDIKACKHMYRYMKEIRKRKIMTVLLCIRKMYPLFQKEIIWNILDYAYSPINERGSL